MSSATFRRVGNVSSSAVCKAVDTLSTATQWTPPDPLGVQGPPERPPPHWVCSWRPQQGPREFRATCGLSTRTCCAPRGFVVSRPEAHGDVHGAVRAEDAEAARQPEPVLQGRFPRPDVGTTGEVLNHGPQRLRLLRYHVAGRRTAAPSSHAAATLTLCVGQN